MAKPVCVMKFGGTSVGDAGCIRRAASIVKSAAVNAPVVVVVSAMSGVTNRLIDAANRAKSGQSDFLPTLIAELKKQHTKALDSLVTHPQRRAETADALNTVFL